MFTLHNGDCLEYLRNMQPGTVDCIITDPPYGIKRDKGFGGSQPFGGGDGKGWAQAFAASGDDVCGIEGDRPAVEPSRFSVSRRGDQVDRLQTPGDRARRER